MCSTMEVFSVPVLFMIFNIYEKKLNWFKTIKSSTLSAKSNCTNNRICGQLFINTGCTEKIFSFTL